MHGEKHNSHKSSMVSYTRKSIFIICYDVVW